MDKKDEYSINSEKSVMAEPEIDYGDKDYVLVATFAKFSKKFFGLMLVKTNPIFMLADLDSGKTRDFRRYKEKDIMVEIIAEEGEPKVLNYYQGKHYQGIDIVTSLLKEIFKNG